MAIWDAEGWLWRLSEGALCQRRRHFVLDCSASADPAYFFRCSPERRWFGVSVKLRDEKIMVVIFDYLEEALALLAEAAGMSKWHARAHAKERADEAAPPSRHGADHVRLDSRPNLTTQTPNTSTMHTPATMPMQHRHTYNIAAP